MIAQHCLTQLVKVVASHVGSAPLANLLRTDDSLNRTANPFGLGVLFSEGYAPRRKHEQPRPGDDAKQRSMERAMERSRMGRAKWSPSKRGAR